MAFTRRWGLLFGRNNETDEEVAKRFTDLVDATLSTGEVHVIRLTKWALNFRYSHESRDRSYRADAYQFMDKT